MIEIQKSWIVLTTSFLLAAGASPAVAQYSNPQADALLNQALVAEEHASNSETADARNAAARLHVESAKLRKLNDPQAIRSLRTAAFYYSHSQPAEAARLMNVAAERALAIGDVGTAANSYLDAAAALVDGSAERRMRASDFAKVQLWIGKAERLADSPLLSDPDRESIRRRVGLRQGQIAG